MKKIYVTPEMRVSGFQCEDIITASGGLITRVNGVTVPRAAANITATDGNAMLYEEIFDA